MQASESFRLSAFLSFSGGLQDAYTYNMRDFVFAIGAGVGGVLTGVFGYYTIWISPMILVMVMVMMV